MRIAIYGAGSLGTILGAYISKGGVPIELINRNKAHVEALKEKGAQVVGMVQFTQQVIAYTPEEMSGKYDVIFLMTKQQHNKEVVQMLDDYLAADGTLVTFQNGLPEMQIADILGAERVLGCTVAWGATLKEAGVCELTSEPDALSFSLGAVCEKRNKNLDNIKAVLELMGKVDVEENFIGTRWSKLLINAAFSGMSAVLGCTFGEAAGPRMSRRVVQALIKECIDVCKAGGIRIEPVQGKDIVKLLDYNNSLKRAFSFFIIPIAIRKHAKLKASMLQDLEKGKLTEVDAINGAVSEYGRRVDCPTPMNDRVVEIVHGIEQGRLKPCFDNLKYFE
ncbi:MAG: ketopantoate reductase family protein [Bacteroidaceae bacterium]|nr:ketopantoate reductase family protein [Bacteroidaceae bacterium]